MLCNRLVSTLRSAGLLSARNFSETAVQASPLNKLTNVSRHSSVERGVVGGLSSVLTAEKTKKHRVTLIHGDGVGPELGSSVVGVFAAIDAPVEWERLELDSLNTDQLQEVVTSINKNGICFKGPLYTPPVGFSRNRTLRKSLDLFANVVPIRSIPGIPSRHQDFDFVLIRENSEGEYSGLEHTLAPGVVQSIKVTTREASLRIARFAFGYARANQRTKVTAIHKANIQKLTDGEFLDCCRTVAKEFSDIQFSEMIIDNTAMQLVMNASQFQVVVTPNLYGNIVANIGAGLLGSPGLLPSYNIGLRGQALFESGNRHVGLDIGGKNVANPIGALISGAHLLRHLGLGTYADKIEDAIDDVVSEKKVRTADIGGNASTTDFTKAVIDRVTGL